ncbi:MULTISPECIES: HAD family phosphatase [unclassified Streptomyces]|uniref:HAD family hydrolase n=1 Tax=unclassified Streptomyces TaxID=2593676 RepID=UPI002E77545F|nr:HAD family phosphatase [Streptomyces sp. JV176]MEE1800382.1 HAD family phosphatase [Streptomyces sp. JV176]
MTDSYAADCRAAQGPARLGVLDAVSVRCVLFDFDGPVCALFRNHPAPDVAARLLAALPEEIARTVGTADGAPVTDPQAVLRAVGELAPGGARVAELEAWLTEEEIRAAESAVPTRHAAELIRALDDAGVALAITTNNSPRAVRRYLERTGLARHFGGHVYGRRHDPRLLKPHPDCLERALKWTGVTAAEAVMIGDAEADLRAAERLGVRFLGYATRETKSAVLYGAGARVVVDELPDNLTELAGQVRHVGQL